MNKLFSRTILVALMVAALAFAQMGGGMGSGSGNCGTTEPGNSGSSLWNMGSSMGMTGAMGSREMADGPTIGPDGTAYVVRLASTATGNQGQGNPGQGMTTCCSSVSKYELVAISVRDGSARWKLEITGTMVSEPALGKDGRIFLTASNYSVNNQYQSGNGMMGPGTSATSSSKSRLLVVTADLLSARISSTVEVDSDVLSAPRTATDETGNYVVYVTGFEMRADDKDSLASGQKNLYAFTPDGRIKFNVKIN